MERLITALAAKGPLREGVDTAMAIDIALALQSPEMYQYLTKRRGWSPSRWEQWTADALITQLLPSREASSDPGSWVPSTLDSPDRQEHTGR